MKKVISFIFLIFSVVLFSEEIFTELKDIKFWEGTKGQAIVLPKVSFSEDRMVGEVSIKAEAVDKGKYQGICLNLPAPIDLKEYEGVIFYIKQGYYKAEKASCVFKINFEDRFFIYTDFDSGGGDWTKVYIPFEPSRWKGFMNREVLFGKAISFIWYPYSVMNEPGKFIMIDGIELVPKIQGKERKILVNTYTYLTSFPETDKNCKLLTDEKIDKDQQVIFPSSSESPEILFDLGGIYKINKIQVDSIAIPSQNISNIMIFSSLDGKTWQHVENIINEDTEGTEKHQIIKKEKLDIVGKFLKLRLTRLRHDCPVYVGEVSFFGEIAKEEDMKRFALKRYNIGPDMPELNERNYWILKGDRIEIWIDKKTGVIGGIFKDKKKIVERLFNTYVIAERGKREVSNGYRDKAFLISYKDDYLKIKTKNEEIPYIEIEKEYELNNNCLIQRLSFKNLADKKFLLYNKTEVVLPKEYRKEGVYESWGGGHKLERRFAEDIIFDFPAEHAPCLTFENFKEKEVLFYYRYKKDNNYVPLSYSVGGFGSIDKESVVFTSNGWVVGDGIFEMDKRETHYLENHLTILKGTILNAYDYYLSLPEVKNFRDKIKRPDWLRDIKCEGSGLKEWKEAKERIVKRFLLLFRDGYILFPALADLNFMWGELPTEGEVRHFFGGRQKAEDLKNEIKRLKEMGKGRVKFGIYTWLRSDNPFSKPFKEHPEWYITKSESGGDLTFFPGVNENYYRIASIEESRQEMIERVHKMINYYGLDIWYLDGGGALEIIDWERLKVDDYYGWHKLYTDLREILKKEDPERILFANHPENPLFDMGFYESFGWTLQKNWRPGAAWMWKFKLFQYKDQLHYPCFIYWLPSTEGYFEDYLVSLGLIPCFSSRNVTPRDVAYVSASYEMRPVEIVEANITPNWRFDKNTNIEVFTLKKDTCGIIFLKSHEEKQVEVKIGVDVPPFGLIDKNKEIHSWLFLIENGRKWKGRFGEVELEDIYKNTGWIFDRVITPIYLGKEGWKERINKKLKLNPEEGAIWMITQSPFFVFSVNELPNQLWLPEVRGIRVDGEIYGNKILIKINSEKEKVEIGCILPEGKIIKSISSGKEKLDFKVICDGNLRFLIIPVKKGKCEIICELEDIKNEKKLSIPEINVTKPVLGKKLNISLNFSQEWINKRFTLQFKKENKISWVNTYAVENPVMEINVSIPEQMEGGKYDLILSDLSGNVVKRDVIEFPQGNPKTQLPEELLPLKENSGLKEINLKNKNIEIYSIGWQFSEGACGYEIDPEKMRIKIYSLPMEESYWNHVAAGMEMKVERYLKLKIKGNFNFFNKYQIKQTHSVKWNNPNHFIGFIIDFNTSKGYIKRIGAGLGVIKNNRTSKTPSLWGKKSIPDEFYSLTDFVLRKDIDEEILWIDLKQLGAPAEWDGKIWISPVMGIIAPDRELIVEILDTSSTVPSEKIKEGINLSINLKEKKVFKVNRKKGEIKIDGKLQEDDWKNALKLDDFSLLYFPLVKAYQKTQSYLLYDDKFIYIGFLCEEKEKEVLSLENSKPWHNDGIEFLFSLNGIDGYFHGIIDGAGNWYAEIEKNKEKKNLVMPVFDFSVYKEKGFFSVEIKLPFEIINIENPKGKKIGFNLMRNRLFKGDGQYFTLVSGSSYFVYDRYFLEFD